MARFESVSQARTLGLPCSLLLFVLGACTRPVPGVLTLAPAGMRATGACVAHPDGTLTMPAGASVESVVYVDAGAVMIAITAQAAAASRPFRFEVWLAGASIGAADLDAAAARPLTFRGQAHASGPAALRITCSAAAEAGGEAPATVHLEKVVITQP